MGVLALEFPHEQRAGVDFSYTIQAFLFYYEIKTTRITMALGAGLQLKLSRKYEPSSMVYLTFRGKDVAVQTDKDGNPVLAFIGKLNQDGKIKGQRYSRTLKADAGGRIIKDHWDLKGKV